MAGWDEPLEKALSTPFWLAARCYMTCAGCLTSALNAEAQPLQDCAQASSRLETHSKMHD